MLLSGRGGWKCEIVEWKTLNSFGENRVTRVQTETGNGFTCSLVESRPWQLEDQELHFYARCSSSQLAKARDFCTAVGESSGHKRFNHLAGGESRSSPKLELATVPGITLMWRELSTSLK